MNLMLIGVGFILTALYISSAIEGDALEKELKRIKKDYDKLEEDHIQLKRKVIGVAENLKAGEFPEKAELYDAEFVLEDIQRKFLR